MADPTVDTVAQVIAQCRRDIASAWSQVEAARDVLRRSRALQQRWSEQAAAVEPVAPVPEPTRIALRSTGFVMIPRAPRAPDDRTRPRLVSGS